MFAALTNLKVLAAIATIGTGIGLTGQTAQAAHGHGSFGISVSFAAPVRVCEPAPVYTPVYTPAYAPVTTYTPVYTPVVVRQPVYVVRPAPVIVTGGYRGGYCGPVVRHHGCRW